MASVDTNLPPLDGSVSVLPGFVDYHAKHGSELALYVFPYPDLSSNELRTISYVDFARATHRIAHALRPKRGGPEGAVIAMIMNVDTVLYHAILVGLIRAGCVPFPMSPRNSAPAIASMLERIQCHRIVSHPAFHGLIASTRAALPSSYVIQIDEAPALLSVFPSLALHPIDISDHEPYPPPPEAPSLASVAFYLHSSGSTGDPKPVPQTHEFVRNWIGFPAITCARIHGLSWGAHALPPFHMIALSAQLFAPLLSGRPTSLFPPSGVRGEAPVVPTPQNTIANARKTGCHVLQAVPSFVEAWANNDDDIEYLASLKLLVFSGGPLSKVNGDKLVARGVRLCTGYGATEIGSMAQFPLGEADGKPTNRSPEDWQWARIADTSNPRWVDQGDGTFELQFLTCRTHRPAVENLVLPSGERGYSTSDLWAPHPTKPNLWRIVGRKDDVIVLSTGEKTVPIQLEAHIGAHPSVSGVIAFGRGHQQIGILVEAKPGHEVDPPDTAAVAEFRNTIWPRVEEANENAPAFARVFKEMILVVDPSRPLPRAGKGTFQRKKALELYAQDIDELYKTVEDSTNAHGVAPPRSWDIHDVQTWLAEHARSIHSERPVDPDSDLFEQRFDSLSATFLRNRIIGGLRGSPDATVRATSCQVPQNFIYQHPTLVLLSKAVSALVHPDESVLPSPSEEIESMIARYAAMLPARGPQAAPTDDSRERVVLLTGTTGNLGAQLLALLLEDRLTKRVYALNRGSALLRRQTTAFDTAQLPVKLLDSPKLVLLSADFTQSGVDLPQDTVDEISRTVTHVVHAAWRVDFNLALASFESQVASAVHLLTMAPAAYYLFASSVSVAAGWNATEHRRGTLVPEATLHDSSIAAATSGYGMSKYVIEEILAGARRRGFKTTTLRIGQISGSSLSGAWNTSEWLPSIVKSSLALGSFPDSSRDVSWVPMDAVARTIVDVVECREVPELINIVHPRPTGWSNVFRAMEAELGVALPFIPFGDWVKKLESVADKASGSDLEKFPSVKLLDYFRAQASSEMEGLQACERVLGASETLLFETRKACSVSHTLAGLRPFVEHDARAWVRCWKRIGFLS